MTMSVEDVCFKPEKQSHFEISAQRLDPVQRDFVSSKVQSQSDCSLDRAFQSVLFVLQQRVDIKLLRHFRHYLCTDCARLRFWRMRIVRDFASEKKKKQTCVCAEQLKR